MKVLHYMPDLTVVWGLVSLNDGDVKLSDDFHIKFRDINHKRQTYGHNTYKTSLELIISPTQKY